MQRVSKEGVDRIELLVGAGVAPYGVVVKALEFVLAAVNSEEGVESWLVVVLFVVLAVRLD